MKSEPSWAAAVSSSRNDFTKHEVICLHVPGKSLERSGPFWRPSKSQTLKSRGGYELFRDRINRISGSFVFGSETPADPSFLCRIVFWLRRGRGMMLMRGVSL